MNFNIEQILVYLLIVINANLLLNKIILLINHYDVGWWSIISDVDDMYNLASKTTNMLKKTMYYILASASPAIILLFVAYLIYSR